MSEITCSFCRGAGRDSYGILSWQSKCCVCNGKGVVNVEEPYRVCSHCGGTGTIKTFTCTTCMGIGSVPLPSRPISICAECRGSGDDSSNPYLPRLECHGWGFVAQCGSAL
ncbi:MAG: hypothetical protein WCP72_09240 [Desulfomonile sp.]